MVTPRKRGKGATFEDRSQADTYSPLDKDEPIGKATKAESLAWIALSAFLFYVVDVPKAVRDSHYSYVALLPNVSRDSILKHSLFSGSGFHLHLYHHLSLFDVLLLSCQKDSV